MDRVFIKRPKPLPREFLRMFTIDTLLGRWMPLGISNLVETRLNASLTPYVEQVRRLTKDIRLDEVCKNLEKSVAEFNRKGVIETADDVVQRWRAKVQLFRENEALLHRIVFSLERVEEPFADMDRTLILQTYRSLQGSIELKGQRGDLKRTLASAIENRPEDCVGLFRELTEDARDHLQ